MTKSSRQPSLPVVQSFPQANPQPWGELEYEDIDVHRKMDCRRYDGCLDHVAALNYNSFTCTQCEAYAASTPVAPAHGNAELTAFVTQLANFDFSDGEE